MLRANLYAGIAGYADICVAGRNLAFEGAQRFGWTMLGAGAAFGLVAMYDAAF